MSSIAPVCEITTGCQIIYRFGRIEREPVQGDPAGLQLVPKSHPWRSLGGFLNYEHWSDRDRFKELDAAISQMEGDDQERPISSCPTSIDAACQSADICSPSRPRLYDVPAA